MAANSPQMKRYSFKNMTKKMEDKDEDINNPTPGEEDQDETPDENIEPSDTEETDEEKEEDIDFEEELERLQAIEDEEDKPDEEEEQPPKRTELQKAQFTLKNVARRVKELGGNPEEEIGEPKKKSSESPVDTSQFITKRDVKLQEVKQLAKSEAEAKVIMHYVDKGLSVKDAHFLANKNKISSMNKEIDRKNTTVPSNGYGGGGQERKFEKPTTRLSESAEKRLQMSGMTFDPKTKAYVGQKTRLRLVPNGGTVSERLVNGQWVKIQDSSTIS